MSRSRAIFNNPSLEDLGIFSCVITNTDGISSSYTLTEEGESAHSLECLKLDSLVICLGDISAKVVSRAWREVYTPVCFSCENNHTELTLNMLSWSLSQIMLCCMSVRFAVTFKVVFDTYLDSLDSIDVTSFKILSNKWNGTSSRLSDAEGVCKGCDIHTFGCCCHLLLTGLMRLLDISHEHKFPGKYSCWYHSFFFLFIIITSPNKHYNCRYALDIVFTKPVTLYSCTE